MHPILTFNLDLDIDLTRDLIFKFSKGFWKRLVEIFRISLRLSVFEIARVSDPTPPPPRLDLEWV